MTDESPQMDASVALTEDVATRTIEFGGRARTHLLQMLDENDPVRQRIKANASREPVPFTARELKAIAYDLDRQSLTVNDVMNTKLDIAQAIRDLDDEPA